MDNINENDLKVVAEKFKDSMNKLIGPLQTMGEEIRKTSIPVKKQDVELMGKNVTADLLEDGRVVVRFATQDDASKFFEVLQNKSWIKKIFSK
jgi:hypothetical protein